MADGLLGGHVAASGVKHTLYTCGAGVKAVFRLHCSNPSTSSDADIKIFVDDGVNEFIATLAPVEQESTLVIPNLVLSAGQSVKVESDVANVVFIANGIEDLV